MARINIEECWWTDPRREFLGSLVGGIDLADARMIRAWRLAQEFWKNDRQLVPKELFDTLQGAAEIIRAGLAVVRDCSVYVRGSSTYLEWIHEQRENARAAGKKSAEARRSKTGSAQPQKPKKQAKRRTTLERPFEETPNAPNDAEPSYSCSSSFSGSNSSSALENLPPPQNYSAFEDQFDPAKIELIDLGRKVIEDLIGHPPNPGFKKKIPAMLRAVNWDWQEFARIAGSAKGNFESKPEPPPTVYREVTLLNLFGLREAVSA